MDSAAKEILDLIIESHPGEAENAKGKLAKPAPKPAAATGKAKAMKAMKAMKAKRAMKAMKTMKAKQSVRKTNTEKKNV